MNKDNCGILYKNKFWKEGTNLPRYTGKITNKGVDLRMAGWVKVDKNGEQYISISLTPLDYKPPTAPKTNDAAGRDMDNIPEGSTSTEKPSFQIDDNIPF